jgi:hypothetical protein
MTHYTVACCTDETVAEIEIGGDRVTVHPPEGENLFRIKPPPRSKAEDKDRLGERIEFEYAWQDPIHSWITTEYTRRHHVSEILWPGHSSWVMRCTGCDEMARVTESNLPRLARILANGDWSVTNEVVPLGVLRRMLTDSGI